jgi:2-methylcitrate dehydratase PrpD
MESKVEEASSLTREVAAFIAGTVYEDLPRESVRLAKRCLVDGTGVILAGSTDQASVITREYLENVGGKPESAVLGSTLRVPAATAALANGISGHAQDFDDTQLAASPEHIYGLLTHPTTPVLSVTFALGEALGISGKEFLTAFLLGFEVECKIAEAIHPIHYMKGYHTTGTIGAFGAAAAAGKVLGLSEQKMRGALGIVASMSAGIRANFGTMTKPLHAGRAAENGVVAARLAQLGFTSHPHILENPRGYFKIMGSSFTASDPHISENPLWGYSKTLDDGFDLNKISGKLGNPYAIVDPGVSIKPYPSVVLSHPSMNALLELAKEYDLRPEDVAEIHVYGGTNVVNILYDLPQTGLEGKFSLHFCLTCILLRRRASLKDFSDELVRSPEVQQMMKRIKTFLDPEIETKGHNQILSRIEVKLKDGRILKKDSGPYKGGPEKPLSEAELDEKFVACAGLVLPEEKALQALNLLKQIEKLQDIRFLVQSLLSD